MYQRSKMQETPPMQLSQPDLRSRTKTLSVRVLRFSRELPETADAQLLGKRLIHHVTRAGAYYRAALRCRKLRYYIKRLDYSIYDLELSSYWLELLIESQAAPKLDMTSILTDVQEVITILVGCKRKAKKAGHKQTEMSSN
jgi:hypothetical protein